LNLKLEIKKVSDGEVTTQVWPNWDWGGPYWWDTGNAYCDCNRELFFFRAKGVEKIEDELECDHGRYLVRCSDNDTGEVLYKEFE